MTTFEDRENAFEKKYAQDQETLFRIEAKASKMLGLWAAQEMGVTGTEAETYASSVVAHNLKEPGLKDVVEKISQDLTAKNRPADAVGTMLSKFLKDAETQVRAA